MITVNIASIPTREQHLEEIIKSQIQYVDRFEVYLNNYNYIPRYLNNSKINVYTSQQYGDLGDCGKFFNIERINGYVICLDDDLHYPNDYIEKMIEKIDLHKRTSLICVHGNLLPSNNINSYYKEKHGLHFSKELSGDTLVDIPGTGTLGLHADFIKIPFNIFKSNNMTDLWLGLYALQQNIPIWCISRRYHWLQQVTFNNLDKSIRQRYCKNDHLQTEIANNIINLKKNNDVCMASF